ncbi:MAG: hypothetical protein A3E87_03540 [Gammaproteobacteria bacterium RIFCSPHIGHO2_12_FULL_35_23]|nr:MAG: hypothetical protein A3E87_03540 [Gammaproteobacteria bacterium RIFCSPHIGHO2_12_FULL_35_23]
MPPKKKAADKKSKPAAPMSPLVPTGGEIDESSTKERRTGGVAVVGAISARLAPAPALATPAAGGEREEEGGVVDADLVHVVLEGDGAVASGVGAAAASPGIGTKSVMLALSAGGVGGVKEDDHSLTRGSSGGGEGGAPSSFLLRAAFVAPVAPISLSNSLSADTPYPKLLLLDIFELIYNLYQERPLTPLDDGALRAAKSALAYEILTFIRETTYNNWLEFSALVLAKLAELLTSANEESAKVGAGIGLYEKFNMVASTMVSVIGRYVAGCDRLTVTVPGLLGLVELSKKDIEAHPLWLFIDGILRSYLLVARAAKLWKTSVERTADARLGDGGVKFGFKQTILLESINHNLMLYFMQNKADQINLEFWRIQLATSIDAILFKNTVLEVEHSTSAQAGVHAVTGAMSFAAGAWRVAADLYAAAKGTPKLSVSGVAFPTSTSIRRLSLKEVLTGLRARLQSLAQEEAAAASVGAAISAGAGTGK